MRRVFRPSRHWLRPKYSDASLRRVFISSASPRQRKRSCSSCSMACGARQRAGRQRGIGVIEDRLRRQLFVAAFFDGDEMLDRGAVAAFAGHQPRLDQFGFQRLARRPASWAGASSPHPPDPAGSCPARHWHRPAPHWPATAPDSASAPARPGPDGRGHSSSLPSPLRSGRATRRHGGRCRRSGRPVRYGRRDSGPSWYSAAARMVTIWVSPDSEGSLSVTSLIRPSASAAKPLAR